MRFGLSEICLFIFKTNTNQLKILIKILGNKYENKYSWDVKINEIIEVLG